MAIWGIVHERAYWLGPMEVVAEREDSKRRVTCAEVHPSKDYWLSSDGGADEQPASFRVAMEARATVLQHLRGRS